MWRLYALAIAIVLGGLFGVLWLLTSLVINVNARRQRLSAADFARLAEQVTGPVETLALTSSDGVRTAAWRLPAELAPGAERWAVILTHGGGDDKRFYLPLAEQLRGQGFDVLLPDLRGHGESEASPRGMTLGITEGRDVAAVAAYLADREGVRHIAAGGVSMGGVSTVMGAVAEPRIGPLVLEATSYQAQTVFDYMLRMFRIPAGPVRSGLARVITSFGVWRMGGSWPDIRDGVLPTLRLAGSLSARPVVFLYGDRDPFVNDAAVETYAARFAGPKEVLVFKNTGHGAYKKNPDQFSMDVLRFLNAWRSSEQAAAKLVEPGAA